MTRLAFATFLSIVAMVQPGGAADVEKGRALAGRLCAVCHMQPGQGEKQGSSGLPGFTAIANRPGQSHEHLVRWLRSVPAEMPDHRLTWDEADALAAFIMSLRSPP
jgi:mono/diheme cytochrome c family protein